MNHMKNTVTRIQKVDDDEQIDVSELLPHLVERQLDGASEASCRQQEHCFES